MATELHAFFISGTDCELVASRSGRFFFGERNIGSHGRLGVTLSQYECRSMYLPRIEALFFCQASRSLVNFDLGMFQAVSGPWP